ncbi:hypothetical protein BGZ96_002846 [Linnemannia gamsii]|uniref:Invertebrate defensins family profile domain-containing protein n=1 Tax=Linnemannia gamsii TaxID=64522 RepID=A0ABQ7JKW5_9FUNG|nr:hypothetical protein BGZ96_002846 [Linnemannia gamsii]
MFTSGKLSFLAAMIAAVGILGLTSINNHGPAFALAAPSPAPAPVPGLARGSSARVRRDVVPYYATSKDCIVKGAADDYCEKECKEAQHLGGFCDDNDYCTCYGDKPA